MSDHCEEQEMEAEALAAIFDTSFGIISPNQPFKWYVELVPIDCGGDEEEDAKQNHVGVKLIVDIPLTYPDVQPELDIEVVKVGVCRRRWCRRRRRGCDRHGGALCGGRPPVPTESWFDCYTHHPRA